MEQTYCDDDDGVGVGVGVVETGVDVGTIMTAVEDGGGGGGEEEGWTYVMDVPTAAPEDC